MLPWETPFKGGKGFEVVKKGPKRKRSHRREPALVLVGPPGFCGNVVICKKIKGGASGGGKTGRGLWRDAGRRKEPKERGKKPFTGRGGRLLCKEREDRLQQSKKGKLDLLGEEKVSSG